MSFIRYTKTACMVLLGCLVISMPMAGWAQSLGKVKVKAPPKEDVSPENLTPAQVDGYLAGLSDEQARKLLAAELKKKAAKQEGEETKVTIGREDKGFVFRFYAAQSALTALADQIAGIIGGAHTSAATDVWEKLVGGGGFDHFLKAVGSIFLIILMGLAAERLLLRKTEKLRSQVLQAIPHGGWEKAGLILSRLLLDSIGLAVYVLVTFLAHFILNAQWDLGYLVSSAIILTDCFRIIEMIARLVASPKAPELRLLLMSDSDARFLYRWIVLLTASVLPASVLALGLLKSGASRELFLFVYATVGPIMSILLAVMIWQLRRRVAQVICPSGALDSTSPNLFRQRCADLWHYPAILLVLAVGGYWWARVLTHADTTIVKLIMSLFVVPLCIGLDQWLNQLFARLGRKTHEVIDFTKPAEAAEAEPGEPVTGPPGGRDKTSGTDVSIYFPLIRKSFRTVLLVFLLFGVLELWGIELDIGWIFARNILGVVIALILGLIAWEVAKARIDRKLEEEMPFQSDEAEEGGSGGSRSGTLLMLLRKFILVFLFIVVGFSILASLGVNIAPLLAGAGVVGLAIGFGSQTLVKDIIAGVFFLIDDAFRVGDYVEAGKAKGTVEHISLRSVRLRHPRGQIFVVPFGDLSMVQNFTRDYIIEKLDVRVPFDTDPNVIRKIVKKINKEIQANEELGGFLLSDIKSAGVRAMDDSAMIIRVKFKCIPGEQFILRREVLQQIQKAFREKGIEFADRKVTVYLPPQPAASEGAPNAGTERTPLEAAAGAAAAAAIMQAEAEALAKLAEEEKPD